MPDLTGDERAELERLRVEVAALRGARPRSGRGARWSLAAALLVVAALVGIAAVAAVFTRTELLDTGRYVETVAPLARDPVVQQAVADRVTDELVTRLDLEELLTRLVEALEAQGAPEVLDGLIGPVRGGISSFIESQVRTVLGSEQFARVWDAANRAAHDELDSLLTTGEGRFLGIDEDTLYLDLGAIFAAIKQRLVDAGLTLVQDIPDLDVRVPLVASADIPRIQGWVRVLDRAAWVLPIATVLLLAAAVLVAPDRRRGLLLGAAGFAVGMLVLLAATALARTYYLDNLPATVRSRDAAAAIYDTLLRFLVAGAQTLVVIGLLVAAACWLAGPGRVASGIRHGTAWLFERAATLIGRLRLPLDGLPGFLARHGRPVKVALVVAAAAVLVVWRQPGVSGTLWVAAALVLLVGLVELVRRIPLETTEIALK